MSSAGYALTELKKFNNFVIENLRLRDIFVLNDYDFLHIYQTLIFFDFKDFYEKNKVNDFKTTEESPNLNTSSANKVVFSFLISLLSFIFLILSRRRVLIYSADRMTSPYKGDFSVSGLYGHFFKNKIKFVEILHTTFGPDFYSDFFKRRRPVIYLESFDIFYKMAIKLKKPSDFEDIIGTINAGVFDDKQFARGLMIKYLRLIDRSKLRIEILKRVLSLTAAKLIIGPFDTRNVFELIEAGNSARIKTFFFQSGALSKYDIGFTDNKTLKGKIIKPEKLFVEADYWKKELFRLGTYFENNEIEIGGNLKQDYMFAALKKSAENRQDIVILIPFELFGPKMEITRYINAFLNCGAKVFFKARPDIDAEKQLIAYGLENVSGVTAVVNIEDVLDKIDFIAGTYSTLLYEMIGKGKPVVVLKTNLDHGEGMVINGLADELDITDSDFCEKLTKIKNTAPDVLARRRERLYGGYIPLKETLEEILQKIVFIKTENP